LKHCGLFPHRMDARDRHNGQRDKRTNVRPSLRLYRKKLHTVYPVLYKPTLKNRKIKCYQL